jgi:hypothetical protein
MLERVWRYSRPLYSPRNAVYGQAALTRLAGYWAPA